MPDNQAYKRYRAEADFALSRLRFSREAGDETRSDYWHRTWSLSEAAAEAEATEAGAGVRLLRRKSSPTLRPLPDEVPPLAAAHLPALPSTPDEPVSSNLQEVEPPDPLAAALERHGRIEAALRSGGPNPLPDEMEEGEWQYHLTAFRVGGPYDCELLQAAEAAVEAIVEVRPEFWDPVSSDEVNAQAPTAEEPARNKAYSECLRIYAESLVDLTEEELRADYESCRSAGRDEPAALIEVELKRREREFPPDLAVVVQDRRTAEPTPAGHPEPPVEAAPTGLKRSPPVRDGGKSSQPAANGRLKDAHTPERRDRSGPRSLPPDSGVSDYRTAPAWIDTAGRTRTWSLFSPDGEKMAEIVTKRDAETLAALFNGIVRGEVCLSPEQHSSPLKAPRTGHTAAGNERQSIGRGGESILPSASPGTTAR